MNETSSRAHTIVVITLTQRTRDPGTGIESSKSSSINLVDLAGRYEMQQQLQVTFNFMANILLFVATFTSFLLPLMLLLRQSFDPKSLCHMTQYLSLISQTDPQ
jgi:hypothetical protein